MTALVLGLVLLALVAARPTKGIKASELTPEQGAVFQIVNGQLYYRGMVAELIISSLLYRTAYPAEVPNVVMVMPGAGDLIGPDNWGAYYVLQALHGEGNDIWVPSNMHLPTAEPRPVMYLPPGQSPPPQYALLIAAAQPWPTLPLAP